MLATVEQSEQALHSLAKRLDEYERTRNAAGGNDQPDRTLGCTLRDLDVSFTGRFTDGRLVDLARGDATAAQIRVELTSDDLIALVDGKLDLASAWMSGRVKIHAGMRDLIKLRSLF